MKYKTVEIKNTADISDEDRAALDFGFEFVRVGSSRGFGVDELMNSMINQITNCLYNTYDISPANALELMDDLSMYFKELKLDVVKDDTKAKH